MKVELKSLVDAATGLDFERNLFAVQGSQIGMWTAMKASLVCPKAYERRAGFDLAIQRSAAGGWPVHRRLTGGGTVPQGPGVDNLVLAINASERTTIEDVYRLLTEIIKRGLGRHGAVLETGDTPGSFCDGDWNLSLGGRKVVGTAQRWRPRKAGVSRVLAHALILTKDTFGKGANAVARFHEDLGLGPVCPDAHTSLEAAFGLAELPIAAIQEAAEQALAASPSAD